MGFFDLFRSTGGIPSGAPDPSVEHELLLYKYDSCPYCRRVFSVIDRLDVQVEYRDILRQPEWRQDLMRRTGRTTVPMLLIDDQPLFESADIARWLGEHFAPAQVP